LQSRALAAHPPDIQTVSLQKIVGGRDEICQGLVDWWRAFP
jgi:hypothetical protein